MSVAKMRPSIKVTHINMTGERSSISAIFLVERNTKTLEIREGGPYSKLILSISFLLSSYSGSDIAKVTKKASTATPKKIGRMIFAEPTACFLM